MSDEAEDYEAGALVQVERAPTGQFVKGVSGNSSGRTPGSKNKISLQKLDIESHLRDHMAPKMLSIIDKAMELALAGDTDMIKLFFKSWVTGTQATSDDPPPERINVTVNTLNTTAQPAALSNKHPVIVQVKESK